MPPSQLKQLKASLREHGVLGPQQSKKEKKRNVGRGGESQKKVARHEALQGIRERFNPFEVKNSSRKKFDVTSNKDLNGASKKVIGRPGVTKGLGEQRRKETLLREIQRRQKVGGILDRRFGEDDPSITPEQKAAERYARESEQRLKKNSIFNLEEDDREIQLTHGGRSLELEEPNQADDFDEGDLHDLSNDGSADSNDDLPRKRRRLSAEDIEPDEEGLEEKVKTKKEVMEEVIAKSKLHRYERQQAKEEDDDLRAELDKGLPEFFDLLRQRKNPETKLSKDGPAAAFMNPERAALIQGKDRKTTDEEYNERVRQMGLDQRSKPSERTKTDQEKLEEEAARLHELEQERLKRMHGQEESSDENDQVSEDEIGEDDAETFGLTQTNGHRPELDVEDEDNFLIDEDLVASDPDADISLSEGEESELGDVEDEEQDEFIDGLTLPPENHQPNTTQFSIRENGIDINELPTVVQRIRALYHPKLDATNKDKLENFCPILVKHVAYLAKREDVPFGVLENLLRHVHSLAKTFPLQVGLAFRDQLIEISEERSLQLTTGDLVILTGVLHIFPTSDHFHSVVTPSMLVIARYLAQSTITSLADISVGLYCCTLALEYQRFSGRYVPEAMLYILNTILSLAAEEMPSRAPIPYRASTKILRIREKTPWSPAPLAFLNAVTDSADDENLKAKLLRSSLDLLDAAAKLWADSIGYIEIFDPAGQVLDHLLSTGCVKKMSSELVTKTQQTFSLLKDLETEAAKKRKPLALHNHRPLAIKQAIPKFEEGFNPDRHYDPDRERSEMNKLKAEHKKERKGAMRELRKDANFIARESLREKKERDAAYEKKYRRLVAEIQGEEGKEAKEYEREKRKRKGKR